MKIYAVIPTHNRPDELAALLRSIPPDAHVLVIDNASEPAVQTSLPLEFLGRRIEIKRDEEQPPNLSRLWNIGLDWAAGLEQRQLRCDYMLAADESAVLRAPEYAVAILNDDVVLPSGFLGHMADALEHHGADIAFPGPYANETLRCVRKGPVQSLAHRMTGWCFVLRGSAGLRADERLRWWCGDDDLEQQALQGGRGTVGVAQRVFNTGSYDTDLRHLHPDESTVGVLREQTEKDMATFVKKWGFRPW